MNAKKAAPKSASLSRSAEHAGGKVIGVAGGGKDAGILEVRGQRRQRRARQGHVIIHQINQRKTRRSHAAIRRRRDTLLARAALEAHFWPMGSQPWLAIIAAGIVGDENFRGLAAGGLESPGRF